MVIVIKGVFVLIIYTIFGGNVHSEILLTFHIIALNKNIILRG